MSKLPFEFLLALRYLRPKRTFVSIITLISVIGVALGVAVLIIVISVMSGYDHDFREKILGFSAHLEIAKAGNTMNDYAAVADRVATAKNVRGVSPFVLGPVLVITQGGTNQPSYQDTPVLRGVDPQNESKVSQLPKQIVEGNFDLSGHGMVVGLDFANNLHLQIGDHLSIYSVNEFRKMKAAYDRKQFDETILPADYEVRGIFSTGYGDYDAHVVITSLENAQDLYDMNDTVHGLYVMLDDPDQASAAKSQLMNLLGEGFYVATWMEKNSGMLTAILVEKNLMFYIMFFIVIVAAFGITCTMITFVMMKTREIGLMKAVGASNRQVMSVFVAQSVVISLFGIAAGLGLGFFALHVRNDFLHFMNHLTGRDLFSKSIYGFGELPAMIVPGDIAIICGGSLVICLVAAILPAWHASKMKTVEALRHE
jgi:lipoprotein-releasing system permease protein